MRNVTTLTAGETEFNVTFEWDEKTIGVPGAFIIRNHHYSQFYLKQLTLHDVPGHGTVVFVCNSWVYPTHRYNYDRVFFSNKVLSLFLKCIKCRKDYNNVVLTNLGNSRTSRVKLPSCCGRTGRKNWLIYEVTGRVS